MWPPSQKKVLKQTLVCGSLIYYEICSQLIQAVIIRTAQDIKMKESLATNLCWYHAQYCIELLVNTCNNKPFILCLCLVC